MLALAVILIIDSMGIVWFFIGRTSSLMDDFLDEQEKQLVFYEFFVHF